MPTSQSACLWSLIFTTSINPSNNTPTCNPRPAGTTDTTQPTVSPKLAKLLSQKSLLFYLVIIRPYGGRLRDLNPGSKLLGDVRRVKEHQEQSGPEPQG